MKNDDLQSANRRKSLPCKELSVIDQSLFWIWFFENHPAGFYGAPAPDAGGSVHTFTFKALGGVRKLRRGGRVKKPACFAGLVRLRKLRRVLVVHFSPNRDCRAVNAPRTRFDGHHDDSIDRSDDRSV